MEVFRKHVKDDLCVRTSIIESSGSIVVMKAEITTLDDTVLATGHAEEVRGVGLVNKTSALENCETSAIGRALASLGIHGGEFASLNEVEEAKANQKAGTGTAKARENKPNNSWTKDLQNAFDDVVKRISTAKTKKELNTFLDEEMKVYEVISKASPSKGNELNTIVKNIEAVLA
tara:strand:+ start:680 stop:1204 length:525 start_codon:yes stop_codon:yes gene_type:complete